MTEIVSAKAHLPSSGVNFMLDQCHNIEEKIPGQIRSVLNVQQARRCWWTATPWLRRSATVMCWPRTAS